MTANRFEKYCETIRDVLWDEEQCLQRMLLAQRIIDELLEGNYETDKAKDSTMLNRAQELIQTEQG